MRKTYVGYDLGDGETVVDRAVADADFPVAQQKQDFPGMVMPGYNTPGVAMPTAFAELDISGGAMPAAFAELDGKLVFSSGILQIPTACKNIKLNFKRRPTDLLPKLTEDRKDELLNLFSNSAAWPTDEDFPEGNTNVFREFKGNVIRFTDTIFNDKEDGQGNYSNFYNALKSAAFNSGAIVFCVGHPTKWDDLDIAIYKAIFRKSILGQASYAGKPTELIMVAESRAAFLYVKEETNGTVIPKGKCVLLLDVGSSTIDLTAMSADSRNQIYNSGSNYLGARGIDFIIRDWYLSELRQDDTAWNNYKNLSSVVNSSIPKALTLACRTAKENIYSNGFGISTINCVGLPPLRLTKEKLAEFAQNASLGSILRQELSIPEETLGEMGKKSWSKLFKDFLCQQKRKMEEAGVEVARIILTGSASRMDFVKPIIKEVFNEVSEKDILNDTDPSRTISKGLALAGLANDRSKRFQADLVNVIQQKLPKIIEDNLDDLANPLSEEVAKTFEEIARKRMIEWRAGKITTLNDMNDQIKADCEEYKLVACLECDEAYKEIIKGWLTNKVGKDVAAELHALCIRYGVNNDLTVEDLNIMAMPAIGSPIYMNPVEGMNLIAGLVSIVAGIVAWLAAEVVLGLLIGLMVAASMELGYILLGLLITNPVIFFPVFGAAAVWTIVYAFRAGKNVINQVCEMLQNKDLPPFVRNSFTDAKINAQFTKKDKNGLDMHTKICAEIKAGILADESKAKLVAELSEKLGKAVERRADDIRYVIEAK